MRIVIGVAVCLYLLAGGCTVNVYKQFEYVPAHQLTFAPESI